MSFLVVVVVLFPFPFPVPFDSPSLSAVGARDIVVRRAEVGFGLKLEPTLGGGAELTAYRSCFTPRGSQSQGRLWMWTCDCQLGHDVEQRGPVLGGWVSFLTTSISLF